VALLDSSCRLVQICVQGSGQGHQQDLAFFAEQESTHYLPFKKTADHPFFQVVFADVK